MTLASGFEFLLIGPGESRVVAFYGLERVRLVRPVRIGDTIFLDGEVVALQARDPERGLVRLLARGASRADRDPAEVELILWTPFSISDDAGAVCGAVKPYVARMLSRNLPASLRPAERRLAQRLAAKGSADGFLHAHPDVEIPDEILAEWAIAGTPDDLDHFVGSGLRRGDRSHGRSMLEDCARLWDGPAFTIARAARNSLARHIPSQPLRRAPADEPASVFTTHASVGTGRSVVVTHRPDADNQRRTRAGD